MIQKHTLVIGASENIERYSNKAIRMLLKFQYTCEAFGQRAGEVEGIPIDTQFPTKPNHFDTITLYINPTIQQDYYHHIIKLAPKRIIFNPGTENPEFASIAAAKGIQTVEACTLVLLTTGQY